MAELVCDFCYSPHVMWEYHLRPDTTLIAQLANPDQIMIDSGEWLACAECKRLIDVRDIGALGVRALQCPAIASALSTGQFTIAEVRFRSGKFLGLFFRFLDGPGKPYPPPQVIH